MGVRTYRLVVDGEPNDRELEAFEGMMLTHERGRTVLTGPVRDQAELQGHLQRVSALGLTLLGATPVADEARSTEVVADGAAVSFENAAAQTGAR